MRLLLDTHTLIWWTLDSPRLPHRAREAVEDTTNEVFVSATSAIEVTIKHRLGKFPQVGALAGDFEGQIAAEGFLGLPISLHHAQIAGSLAFAHRDPFDRLLVAQALIENLVLVSNEQLFDQTGVSRLW